MRNVTGLSSGVLVVVLVVSAISVAGAVAISYDIQTSGEVTYTTNTGVEVSLTGGANLAGGQPFVNDSAVSLTTDQGNVTVSGSGDSNVTITEITGSKTILKNLDVSGSSVTVNPEDKPAITVGGDADNVSFTDMALDDGAVDFSYAGSSGDTTVTVRGLASDTTVAAVDGTDTVLAKGTTNSNGVLTLTLPNSQHDVELQSSDLNDPQLSDADPVGTQSTTPSELSVNVSDADFPADNVTVTFSLDGSQIDTQTIDSDSQVTTSIGALSPGTHNWTVNATDEYGNTQIETYQFGVPSNITIYNESAPEEQITATTVEATIYTDSDRVYNRTTSNGEIDLSGLPTSEDLVIEVDADGYYKRTVIVEDIAEQQRFYLLNRSVSTVEVRFNLDDPTGRFPTETSQLFIKRPLNVSNTTEFETIIGDEFGVAGITTNLENDTRYRLVLKNQEGDIRVLGAYDAAISEEVTLTPGGLELDLNNSQGYQWDYRVTNETGQPTIEYEFVDPERETTNLQITIHERGNSSNTLSGYPTTYSGPVGTVSITEELSDEQANKTWVVEWEADRNGKTIDSELRASANARLFGALPAWVRLWASMGVVLITGGLFSRANANVGAVIVALSAGIFWWIGWMGTAATGASIALGLGIAGLFWAADRGGGL